MELKAIVQRFMRTSNNVSTQARLTMLTSLAIAQTEADYTELTRAGRRFGGGTQTIANGIAPLAAIPTLTATLGLFNPDTSGLISLVPDYIACFLGSGTAAAGLTLFCSVFKPTNPPTANATGYSSTSLSRGGREPKAIWGTGLTVPASGGAWSAVLSNFQLAAANVGQGHQAAQLNGRFVVPPLFALGIAILSGAGTAPLYSISVQWAEVELDLE